VGERAKAWVLDVGAPFSIAISEHEMVEVLETPPSHPIPRGRDYCREVIIRHNEVMPLLDLSRLEGKSTAKHAETAPYTVILAYQTTQDAMVHRAGILVRRAPKGITVGNEMDVIPPSGVTTPWRALLIACFEWQGQPVLIPDLGRLLVP
jgi:chemotaxis signal transduction protein